jgi:hypothetical protein
MNFIKSDLELDKQGKFDHMYILGFLTNEIQTCKNLLPVLTQNLGPETNDEF